MVSDSLVEIVSSLTPEQQAAVREFIQFLRRKQEPPETPFLAAIDEFIDGHPGLLSRLAQ